LGAKDRLGFKIVLLLTFIVSSETSSALSQWLAVLQTWAWPIAAIAIVVIALKSERFHGWILALSPRIRSLSAFGVSVDLNEKSNRRIEAASKQSFDVLREQVAEVTNKLAFEHQVQEKFTNFCSETLMPILEEGGEVPQDLRVALYIDDPLISKSLLQLTNYWPTSDGKAGRALSVRFGIVGRAWRQQKSLADNNVGASSGLVERWGMTKEEASRASLRKHSCACIGLLTDAGRWVGLVYLDADKALSFPSLVSAVTASSDNTTDATGHNLDPEVDRRAGEAALELGLPQAIDEIATELRRRVPRLKIHDDD
jgi:hypothetical protein